jgi:hypothetical protein
MATTARKPKAPVLEMMEVSALRKIMHPGNPQVHPDSQIAKLVRSMEEFGFTNPILLDKDATKVLAGHGRIEAAERKGDKWLPCLRTKLAGAKADAYLIADNKTAREARTDREVLADLLGGIREQDGGFDLTLTGYDEGEVDSLVGGPGDPEFPDGDQDATMVMLQYKMSKPVFERLRPQIDEFSEKIELQPFVQEF